MDGHRLRGRAWDKGGGGSPLARVAGITTGKIVDMDFKDSMNMGAANGAWPHWIPLCTNFKDLGVDETYYDRIITGDLGDRGPHAFCWIIS